MRKRDYYDVLGVPRHATLPEIRRAYRRLARQHCPDVNVWDARAGELFEELAEAYRVLGNAATRAVYDRLGHRGLAGGDGGAPRGEDLHATIAIEFEEALRGVEVVLGVTRQEPCPQCGATGAAAAGGATRCPACEGRPLRIEPRRGVPTIARCPACGGSGWRLPEPCGRCAGRGTVPGPAR